MGGKDSRAVSEDGAATAVPLRVVCHVHSVVGAVDIVYISLSLVPVMNFSERDQLDGLALRKQLAKKNLQCLFKSLVCSGTFISSLLPVG